MKPEEYNDLSDTWMFTEFVFFTELMLFGGLVTKKKKCRSKHTNKNPNHNNISLTEITPDKL